MTYCKSYPCRELKFSGSEPVLALWERRPRRDPWPCPRGVTGLIAARASRRENGGQTAFLAPVEARRDACREVRHAHPSIHIHYNPVKHGWAKRMRDWPYFSCHRYVRLGVYPIDWGGHEVDGLDFEAG